MNLLLLPGGSKRNSIWIAQVEKTLAPRFDSTHIRSYAHWDTEETEINLAREVERLSQELKNFEPYCVFAKSAGSILACKATAEGVLTPRACLFAGFPLAMVVNHDLPVTGWLCATNFPITIIQNEYDPLGSYGDVAAFFKSVGRQHVSLHMLLGDTHDYEDFDTLQKYAGQLP